jgi:hypothetical protein
LRQKGLLLSDFDYGAAFIEATGTAHTVRELESVAIGALRQNRANQEVMRATGGGAALGVTSFGIRHG